jgi:light-regulated signal transduction histidine kinase (bacteriophytochrome)
MRALIYSILDYTSLLKDENKMEDTDLDKILKDVLADFDSLIQEKNATIEIKPLPVIRAIPLQVNQLFYNLIDNALKFNNNSNPALRISCAVAEYKVPGYLSEGNYLQITFADNGTGFDDRYESLMYSMFQQLHGKHEYAGTGIGLTLCKKIMENHHGFIRATGQPDKGATFYLYFPVNPYIQV